MSRREGRLEDHLITKSTSPADNSVSTIKLVDGAVTVAKRGPLNYQLSSSCGAFITSSTSRVDVTNLTVTITTTGRPVVLKLIPDGVNAAGLYLQSGTFAAEAKIFLMRDGVDIMGQYENISLNGATSVVHSFLLAEHVDAVAAGTYTYKIQVNNQAFTSPVVSVNYCKLLAYEI